VSKLLDRIQALILQTARRLYHVEKRLIPIPKWNSDEPPVKDMTKEDRENLERLSG
jgi:hypothetical protein